MKADPEYLRRHYSSLSDDELLAIDRADLVETARPLYDAEVEKRGLGPKDGRSRPERPPVRGVPARDEVEDVVEAYETGEEPDWLDEAEEVYSAVVQHPGFAEDRIATASESLHDAGIPCHAELTEEADESRWRLMVPRNLSIRARSTLERDLENADFEAFWRSQLEHFSDEELVESTPEVVFCGLFDKVERVTKAWEEEVARRQRNVESE